MRMATKLPIASALGWAIGEGVRAADGSSTTFGENMVSIGLLLICAAIGSLLDARKR